MFKFNHTLFQLLDSAGKLGDDLVMDRLKAQKPIDFPDQSPQVAKRRHA